MKVHNETFRMHIYKFFNSLKISCSDQRKIVKNALFRQCKDHNSGWEQGK